MLLAGFHPALTGRVRRHEPCPSGRGRASKVIGIIKRVQEAVLRHSRKLLRSESELFRRKLIFALQRAAEQRGIIRIQHDRHAGIEQSADGMCLERWNGAGADIAGDADFERDLMVTQVLH